MPSRKIPSVVIPFKDHKETTVSLTGAAGAGGSSSTSVTWTGVDVNDWIFVHIPALDAGWTVTNPCTVSAGGAVVIRVTNATAASAAPTASLSAYFLKI